MTIATVFVTVDAAADVSAVFAVVVAPVVAIFVVLQRKCLFELTQVLDCFFSLQVGTRG